MSVKIDIDGGGYAEACDGFYAANRGVIDAVLALSDGLDGCAEMAGSDTGGEAWAGQYDPAASQAVQAGCDLGLSLATMGNLLNASLANHDAADGGAMLYGAPPYASGDTDPAHGTEELSTPAPPSARGGTGDQPGWWHWLAGHLEGLFWPDADTGRLRSAGAAWTRAGDALDTLHWDVETAKGMVSEQTSPEIADAVSACAEVSGHMTALAAAYRDIGRACDDYAKAVDDHHQEIEDELKSFIEWTVGIETAGAVVGFFTLGLGEGAAQAAEAAEVASAASKVRRVLTALVELARTVATTIGRALSRIGEIAGKLTKFLNPKLEKALVKLGVREAEESLPALTRAEQEAMDYALKPRNMEHVFAAKHKFDGLVDLYGSREAVMEQLVRSLGDMPNGIFEVTREIGGETVTIRGNVINGVVKIGTAFIR